MGNKLDIDKSLKNKDGFEVHGIKYPPSYAEEYDDHRRSKRGKKKLRESGSSQRFDTVVSDDWLHFDHPVDNVVLSGGGSKGYAFVGSLKALEDCGILGKMKRIGGSSVGAICAGLIAVGCTPQEIADVFSPDVKWLFQDQECMPITCLPNIWKKFGINPATRFYEIYGAHIAARHGTADLTFGQLYERTGRELCIVVTNLTKMCSEYCHPKTTPDVPIRLAVRMSMSFPVVFQPIQYNTDGTESWYTDGGTLDNYPVHIFDGPLLDMNHNTFGGDKEEEESKTTSPAANNCCTASCPHSLAASCPPSPTSAAHVNTKTLGMYVVSENPMDQYIWNTLFGTDIPYRPTYVPNTKLAKQRLKNDHPKKKKHKIKIMRKKKKQKPFDAANMTKSLESLASIAGWPHECVADINNQQIKHFGDFIIRTIEMLLVHQRQLKIKPSDVHRTIPINCGYIGTNDYSIETGDREFMLRQGYECTKKYLTEFMEKTKEKDSETTDGVVITTEATVEHVEDHAEQLEAITEVHINNSDSSDSGFSEISATESAKMENESMEKLIKYEIVTTETTYVSYANKDNSNKRAKRVTIQTSPMQKETNDSESDAGYQTYSSTETQV